jgi:hypothetical protein
MIRSTVVTGVALAMFASLGSGAVAAKPRGDAAPRPSSISLDQADPNYGDEVTFTTTHPDLRETLRVRVLCHRDDELVYQYASDPAARFHLWSAVWQGGAAECAADLYYFTYRGKTQMGAVYLDRTEFAVSP